MRTVNIDIGTSPR